jgi:hypothetical protein
MVRAVSTASLTTGSAENTFTAQASSVIDHRTYGYTSSRASEVDMSRKAFICSAGLAPSAQRRR